MFFIVLIGRFKILENICIYVGELVVLLEKWIIFGILFLFFIKLVICCLCVNVIFLYIVCIIWDFVDLVVSLKK